MSTKGSIIYWYVGRSDIHLYHECHEDTLRLSVDLFGVPVIKHLWLGNVPSHWQPDHASWWLKWTAR